MKSDYHPARWFAAKTVYWIIWGPALMVALPFAALDLIVRFIGEVIFPTIADVVQPAWAHTHDFAIRCGNGVLGLKTPPRR